MKNRGWKEIAAYVNSWIEKVKEKATIWKEIDAYIKSWVEKER
jgi:hypothetical protein